jgi:ABC-type cobalamin transport system permease subunit
MADAPRACQHWDRSHDQPKEIIMNAIRRIRRLASVLAGVLLASAAAVPAAFAVTNPIPDPSGYVGDPYIGTAPVAPVPAATVRVISTGGMPGWQITLIAVGAALLAATVAVLLDRARAAGRNAATAAT